MGERQSVTDGARICFSEEKAGQFVLQQLSAAGGESAPLVVPFASADIYDISPDRSALLIASEAGGSQTEVPLWQLPIPAGSPRRVTSSGVDSLEASNCRPKPNEKPENDWRESRSDGCGQSLWAARKLVVAINLIFLAVTIPLYFRLGSQFMPALYEGSSLYMPSALPGIFITHYAQACGSDPVALIQASKRD